MEPKEGPFVVAYVGTPMAARGATQAVARGRSAGRTWGDELTDYGENVTSVVRYGILSEAA